MRRLTLITTGGTVEKTYDESTGELVNRRSIVRRMLRRIRLEDTTIGIVELMSKDSLLMTAEDRERVLDAVRSAIGPGFGQPRTDGIVVLHGTDTLAKTGEHLLAGLGEARVPIVLTGAIRPYEMSRSDALQNLTEAIFATGVMPPGVYCAFHGRVLAFPGVVKDAARRTFVKS